MFKGMAGTSRKPRGVLMAYFLCLAGLPSPASAEWQVNGIPVCIATGNQERPAAVSDGAGGVIIAWADRRNTTDFDIYAQRITAAGVPAPGWPPNGVPICTAPGDQGASDGPTVVEDGVGGVYVAWQDGRSQDFDIYMQRIAGSGSVYSGWPINGRAVCIAVGNQYDPVIASDGPCGAMITWVDWRSGSDLESHIYCQRVKGDSSIPAGWPVNGLALGLLGNNFAPTIISDRNGGAFIAWSAPDRIAIQRITMNGTVSDGWPPGGVQVAPDRCQFANPAMVLDTQGGVFVTWEGGYSEECDQPYTTDIYAQRITLSGQIASGWSIEGLLICPCPQYFERNPHLVSDQAGGAFVTWWDDAPSAIHIQHITSTGVIAAGWPAGPGLSLSTKPTLNGQADLVSDSAGGAIVTWQDNDGIFAQRVTGTGGLSPGWPQNGAAVCVAPGWQLDPVIVSDGAGGAIIVWRDLRNGQLSQDIYAQRLGSNGVVPTDFTNGRLDQEFSHVWPNPSSGEVRVTFQLSSPATVNAELFDVVGRRVRSLSGRIFAAGTHISVWDGRLTDGTQVQSGVYWMRVSWPGFQAVHKVTVAR